ncbi:hypothetical protein CTI12_AA407660 [Artemisia annua]|uniref:Uncharacterized protein n=1 Tax=Artemisia annua TaxID=35608 RepID=A0A2U1L2D0_ARTAN|nr:hypothetical protein CTI12_AA407660 [Artemisia annua]
MEDKKLNFNRPLLSVRRNPSKLANIQKDARRKNDTSAPTLLPNPSYKSELHSGPLRDAGTVPFVWEQSPGRPKDERQQQKYPIVPKLPPGRISRPKKQDLDITTNEANGLRKDPSESSKDSRSRDDDHDSHDDVFMDSLDILPQDEYVPKVPQPVPRKEMIKEKPREVKKVVNRENEKPQLTYGPNFLQLNDNDDEDSESDFDEHENMSFKVCGLLPQFCLKGSIGLLNPVPGLSVRTKMPVSSTNRRRAASSSANSQPARVASYEHKSPVKHQKDETVRVSESTEATNQLNSRKPEGTELYDRLQGRGTSNNLIESFPPPVSERKEVNPQNKVLVSFKELLAYENEKEAEPQSPMFEKTLYVDTIHKVETIKPELKENDAGIFEISHIPAGSFKSDVLANKLKPDKEMIKDTGVCKDPKVDKKVKAAQKNGLELPAPPPLPKSPSDSWLWRTLPSVSSKTTSSRSNPKYTSNTTAMVDKNVQSRFPQGLLLPISET